MNRTTKSTLAAFAAILLLLALLPLVLDGPVRDGGSADVASRSGDELADDRERGAIDLADGATSPDGREVVATSGSSVAEETTPVATPPPQVAVLVVRVVHVDDGTPVEGAAVQALVPESSTLHATTGPEGRARLESAAAIVRALVLVGATPTTTGTTYTVRDAVRVGAELEVVVEVGDGHTYAGRVVDEHGAPVVGALVVGWCSPEPNGAPDRTDRTDEDGAFRLLHLGRNVTIDARAADRVSVHTYSASPDQTEDVEDLELVVVPHSSLVLSVRDAGGAPIEGARATSGMPRIDAVAGRAGLLRIDSAEFAARSDRFGAIRVERLPDVSFAVEVSAPGFEPYQGNVRANGETHEVVLARATVVRGRVLGGDGLPLAGASVRYGPDFFGGAVRTGVVTGADGSFELTVAAAPDDPAPAWLVVVAERHAPHFEVPFEFDGADRREPLELRLEFEHAITGRVVDQDGAPVEGADVVATGEGGVLDGAGRTRSFEQVAGVGRSTTDPDGRFRSANLRAERYALAVRTDRRPGQVYRFEVDADAVDVELRVDLVGRLGTTVKGRATDAVTGAAVERFRVATFDGLVARGVDGEYEIRDVEPGPRTFVVRADGFPDFYLDVEVPDAEEFRLDVVVARYRTATFRVVDEEGVPWGPAARLTFEPRAPSDLVWSLSRVANGGDLVLDDLVAAPLTLEVATPFGTSRFDVDLSLPPDGPIELVVPGPRQHDVEVVVLATDGSLDATEVLRRASSDLDVDREWIEELRAAGRLHPPTQPLAVGLRVGDGSEFDAGHAHIEPVGDGFRISVSGRGTVDSADASFELRLAEGRWTFATTRAGSESVATTERRVDADAPRRIVLVVEP
ncbi:MAG: carboxypeptidase-like regulatory domain-containing protein [Planctomycetota bacterium]